MEENHTWDNQYCDGMITQSWLMGTIMIDLKISEFRDGWFKMEPDLHIDGGVSILMNPWKCWKFCPVRNRVPDRVFTFLRKHVCIVLQQSVSLVPIHIFLCLSSIDNEHLTNFNLEKDPNLGFIWYCWSVAQIFACMTSEYYMVCGFASNFSQSHFSVNLSAMRCIVY